jgi:hypothetical protein
VVSGVTHYSQYWPDNKTAADPKNSEYLFKADIKRWGYRERSACELPPTAPATGGRASRRTGSRSAGPVPEPLLASDVAHPAFEEPGEVSLTAPGEPCRGAGSVKLDVAVVTHGAMVDGGEVDGLAARLVGVVGE